MKTVVKWFRRTILIVLLLIFTVYMVRAFDSRSMPDLKLWHHPILESEFSVDDYGPDFTFADYQKMEDLLFRELEEKIYQSAGTTDETVFSRFAVDGQNNPLKFPRNWNRSFELIPSDIKGGALLLHGLSDSPYSLRRVGEILFSQGIYVLGLRIPGHGTIPAALLSATWKDWVAAAKIGARHVGDRVGDDKPFYIVGYSNGGTLAVKYALDAAENAGMRMPDRLILFSPAVGVGPFAFLASWHKAISFIPYFEKFSWLSIELEYDPFKYNSFPKNAGEQSHLFTKALQKQIERTKRAQGISALPPIISFQSLVDATVLTDATIKKLYSKLEGDGHELILFDINRAAQLRPFLASDHSDLLLSLEQSNDLPYRLTLITNTDHDSFEAVEISKGPMSNHAVSNHLGFTWPANVYSLSHVAIPFPPQDPIYGSADQRSPDFGLPIGTMEPRGEKNILHISLYQIMRLRYNPFFGYIEKRLLETVTQDAG